MQAATPWRRPSPSVLWNMPRQKRSSLFLSRLSATMLVLPGHLTLELCLHAGHLKKVRKRVQAMLVGKRSHLGQHLLNIRRHLKDIDAIQSCILAVSARRR